MQPRNNAWARMLHATLQCGIALVNSVLQPGRLLLIDPTELRAWYLPTCIPPPLLLYGLPSPQPLSRGKRTAHNNRVPTLNTMPLRMTKQGRESDVIDRGRTDDKMSR